MPIPELRAVGPGEGATATMTPFVLDEAAFRDAFELHGPAVFRYAASRVGPEAAEDVLSDTFSAAWRSRERFVDPSRGGLEAWLIGVATNVIARYRRAEHQWLRMGADALQHGPATSADDDPQAIEERVDAAVRGRRLGTALSHMPRRERDPLLLHVLREMSYEDIARVLDVPVGTVRSRISRGRRRLAERIGTEGDA